MTDSSPRSPRPVQRAVGYPTGTKLVIVVVLALAGGLFVVAALATDTDREDAAPGFSGSGQSTTTPVDPAPVTIAPGVQARSPRAGTEVLAQEHIVLDLAPGWTGTLELRSATRPAITLTERDVEQSSLDELIFRPGEGREVERLPSGRLCVEATIWDRVRGRAATERVEEWCFDVT